MPIKEIAQPSMNTKTAVRLQELGQSGFRFKWFIDTDCEGRARSVIPLGEIYFRGEEYITPYSVAHELEHFY